MYKAYFKGTTHPNPGPASIGAYILDDKGTFIWEISRRIKDTTNNIAEYTALLTLLNEISERDLKDVEVYGDSQLVVNQTNEFWSVNEKRLELYQLKAAFFMQKTQASLTWIPKEQNQKANELCQRAYAKAV